MLYPTLDSLVSIIGNRYLLVNVVATHAREITAAAIESGDKLSENPVKTAVTELSNGTYVYVPTSETPEEE